LQFLIAKTFSKNLIVGQLNFTIGSNAASYQQGIG